MAVTRGNMEVGQRGRKREVRVFLPSSLLGLASEFWQLPYPAAIYPIPPPRAISRCCRPYPSTIFPIPPPSSLSCRYLPYLAPICHIPLSSQLLESSLLSKTMKHDFLLSLLHPWGWGLLVVLVALQVLRCLQARPPKSS